MEDVKELRQMPEIQNIAAYLRGMTFRKKAFGGYDIESVYEHFSAVTQMYEAILCAYMEQVDRYARESAELRAGCARQEEEKPFAAGQPESPQWYAAPAPQPQPVQQPQPMPMQESMQQQYIAQNPWAPAWSPAPWTQQPAVPQAYYAPQPQQAYAWPNEADSMPEPAYMYA